MSIEIPNNDDDNSTDSRDEYTIEEALEIADLLEAEGYPPDAPISDMDSFLGTPAMVYELSNYRGGG